MNSSVLFLVFNRPEPTQRVFDAIRAQRPARLYVAADGPRAHKEGEAGRCEEVRRICSQVDWPCEVKTLFRSENLGCRRAVSGAITWFFEHEEEGIIIEDDCLPGPDFFRFCDAALARWRDDPRVMHIGGHTLLNAQVKESALFTRHVSIWGWATWRRAWQQYDHEMLLLPRLAQLPLRQWFGGQHGAVRRAIEGIYRNNVDAWGARWFLSVLARDGFSVLPKVNLISNIGFGPDATHTNVVSHTANLPIHPLPEHIELPVEVKTHPDFDQRYMAAQNDFIARVRRVLARMRLALVGA